MPPVTRSASKAKTIATPSTRLPQTTATMAASTVLGKRKAQQHDAPAIIQTRKKRTTRSTLDLEVQNDENAPPALTIVKIDASNGILDEERIVPDELFVDDDTPCRRAEKRGRKVTFATSKLDAHWGISKINKSPLEDSKPLKENASLVRGYKTPLTPSTPRHRNALADAVTPRHQVNRVGRQLLTPKTPRTPGSGAVTVYNTARQLFARGADGRELIGRETERAAIREFVEAGLEARVGRSLYISGPPGTGKSAFTNSVYDAFKDIDGVRLAYVNCMSVRNTQDLHAKLLESVCQDVEENEEDTHKTLRSLFFPVDKADDGMFLITLDEIDHLLTLNLEMVYTLFEWALDPASNLILIGIANALDLTDRFLPRLKAKGLRPQLLPFLPYSVAEIAAVITTRLQSLLPVDVSDKKFVPFVQAPAIQLCAKKVASQTGDLRKAFDIIRRAVDLVESDVKAKHANTASPSALRGVLTENQNLAAPTTPSKSSSSLDQLTALTAPRASLAHLAKVTASAFGNGTSTRLKTLNLQQKATLCAIISHSNRASKITTFFTPTTNRSIFATPKKSRVLGKPEPAPTVKDLYETYSGLCKRDGALAPLTSTEFADVVASLEGLGLVVEEKNVLATPRKSKGLNIGREEKKVRGCVSEKEVEGCLDGVAGPLLKSLLKGDD